MNNTEIIEKIIRHLRTLKTINILKLRQVKSKFANQYKIGIISNAELLWHYKRMVKEKTIEPSIILENILKKRAIRTLSGVAPIAVLTKHYPCPGHCVFCPTEKNMPKSYLSNEPAVMRAILTKFNPYNQIIARLRALETNGHSTNKVELIVMGGTFNYFPRQYQTWFIKRCFEACNGRTSKTLAEAQKINETAKHRIIGLTLETRPDYVNEEELINFRRLGCTKIEIGVQAIDNKILTLNRRGHTVEQIIIATRLMKQAGFKIAYHLMPNLLGSTPAKDLQMFKKLFSSSDFQPDMLKIYPTVVTKGSALYKKWRAGDYRPYTPKQLITLLLKIKLAIPNYVRLIRLIRDIPKESIEAGNKITNLRQILADQMKAKNIICHCIRCREAREHSRGADKAKLYTQKYQASDSEEYFLHFSSHGRKILYAFLRLRLNDRDQVFIPELKNAALIREVHTYGRLTPVSQVNSGEVQHRGLGRRLMAQAEQIAKDNGYTKMAVIAGVGVRGYYRLLGYRLEGTYMTKKLVT